MGCVSLVSPQGSRSRSRNCGFGFGVRVRAQLAAAAAQNFECWPSVRILFKLTVVVSDCLTLCLSVCGVFVTAAEISASQMDYLCFYSHNATQYSNSVRPKRSKDSDCVELMTIPSRTEPSRQKSLKSQATDYLHLNRPGNKWSSSHLNSHYVVKTRTHTRIRIRIFVRLLISVDSLYLCVLSTSDFLCSTLHTP